MALIKKFEEIIAWQEARRLVSSIYRLTNAGALAKDYGLRDQLQRAAVSAMTNIAEALIVNRKSNLRDFLVLRAAQQWKFNLCCTRRLMLVTSTKSLSWQNISRQRKQRL